MTTYYTWRLVFAGETVVVLVLMLFLRLIPATAGRVTKLDLTGAILSAARSGAGGLRHLALEPVGLDYPERIRACGAAWPIARVLADRDRRRAARHLRAR